MLGYLSRTNCELGLGAMGVWDFGVGVEGFVVGMKIVYSTSRGGVEIGCGAGFGFAELLVVLAGLEIAEFYDTVALLV